MTNQSQHSDLDRGVAALRTGEAEAAKAILRPLAEGGDAAAQYYMGRACEAHIGPDAPADAIGWYRHAIAGGSMEAVYELGRLYRYDDVFGPAEKAEADDLLRSAARHFEKRAEAGDPQAQCRFGKMLVRGEGVAPDRARGLDWWRKGAPQAGTGWQVALATELGDEENDAVEWPEAVEWAERAATDGHSGAAYNLGARYATGDGVAKDYAKAVHWYAVAAQLGVSEAKYNLGCMYCDGEGVPKDREYGRKLLIEAGEEGNGNALYLLADAYRDGFWGFPKDEQQAARWRAEYERATAGFRSSSEDVGEEMSPQMETHHHDRLSIGYFDDFSEPTLLIWGGAHGLKRLADLLDGLPHSREDQIWFSQLPWVTRRRKTDVVFGIVEHESKVGRLEIEGGNRFEIRATAKDARRLAAQMRIVANADRASHAYLDLETASGVTVLLSKGEYPENWPVDG